MSAFPPRPRPASCNSPESTRRGRRQHPNLKVELLEPRCVPALLTVTNLNDSGDGSLRAALLAANQDNVPDQVQFAAGLAGTLTLTSGELLISQPVTITGPGPAALTLTSNNASRIFNVDDG